MNISDITGWISIDELHPIEKAVLLLCWNSWSDIPFRRVGFYSYKKWYSSETGSRLDNIYKITHWANLPEANNLKNPFELSE